MRVVADSHAVVWFVQGSDRLSSAAAAALSGAEATDGIVVSVATLVDLWYVTQTTQRVSPADLTRVGRLLRSSPAVDLVPIDFAVVEVYVSIPRNVLTDPWDRFIVATARSLGHALVTSDRQIHQTGLVQTIW